MIFRCSKNSCAADGAITAVGRTMVQLPLEPQLARAVLAALDGTCAPHMLTVAAMLTIENLFHTEKPPRNRSDAENARMTLKQQLLVRTPPPPLPGQHRI